MFVLNRMQAGICRGLKAAAVLAFSLVAGIVSRTATAAEFYAVVESTGKRPYASLDVAVDTRSGLGVNVDFRVYDVQGNQLAQFFVPTDVKGFSSTESFANLFALSAGQPLVVRAITAQLIVNSGATLNVRSANGASTTVIPPVLKLDGTLLGAGRIFSIALGSFRSARLLIANISGADQIVDVFQGTEGQPGQGIYSNGLLPNRGHWRVNLTQNEALSNLVIVASGPVVVQLVVDDGKTLQSSMVLPGA